MIAPIAPQAVLLSLAPVALAPEDAFAAMLGEATLTGEPSLLGTIAEPVASPATPAALAAPPIDGSASVVEMPLRDRSGAPVIPATNRPLGALTIPTPADPARPDPKPAPRPEKDAVLAFAGPSASPAAPPLTVELPPLSAIADPLPKQAAVASAAMPLPLSFSSDAAGWVDSVAAQVATAPADTMRLRVPTDAGAVLLILAPDRLDAIVRDPIARADVEAARPAMLALAERIGVALPDTRVDVDRRRAAPPPPPRRRRAAPQRFA